MTRGEIATLCFHIHRIFLNYLLDTNTHSLKKMLSRSCSLSSKCPPQASSEEGFRVIIKESLSCIIQYIQPLKFKRGRSSDQACAILFDSGQACCAQDLVRTGVCSDRTACWHCRFLSPGSASLPPVLARRARIFSLFVISLCAFDEPEVLALLYLGAHRRRKLGNDDSEGVHCVRRILLLVHECTHEKDEFLHHESVA